MTLDMKRYLIMVDLRYLIMVVLYMKSNSKYVSDTWQAKVDYAVEEVSFSRHSIQHLVQELEDRYTKACH